MSISFPSIFLSFLSYFLPFSFHHSVISFLHSFFHSSLFPFSFHVPLIPLTSFFPSFYLRPSILPIRPQFNQISNIFSCTYIPIPKFRQFNLPPPFFSQSILPLIITFSIHSSSKHLEKCKFINYSLRYIYAIFSTVRFSTLYTYYLIPSVLPPTRPSLYHRDFHVTKLSHIHSRKHSLKQLYFL